MATSESLKQLYAQRAGQFSTTLRHVKQQINSTSNLRLLIAGVFLITLYFAFKYFYLFYALPFLLLAFVLLIRKHSRLFERETHLENLVQLNENELKVLEGDASSFSAGIEFIDTHHAYAHDLDIFGERSLFQFLTRANTRAGKQALATRLKFPLSSADAIGDHQEAIRELTLKIDFRQDFHSAGKSIDEKANDRDELMSWLKAPSLLYGKAFYKIALIALPALAIILLIGLFFSDAFRPFIILIAAIQWTILGINIKKINAFHDYISRKKNVLQKYAALLHFIERENFQSKLMKNTGVAAKDASEKVKRLADLVYKFDARANALMSLAVNSLLMYDLNCVYNLEKWKEDNADKLMIWLDAIADTELLNSFATFAFNNQHFVYPEVSPTFTVDGDAVGHPLIPQSESIKNSFRIGTGENIMIITGANMAGKSTFLRTVGINMVLALNGSPVCASHFQFPVITLRTGMRTADSLKDHQSYFYAELDRLKGIIDDLKEQKPLLILLDEILKGTNSADKQAGSIALVKQLLPHPCLVMVATHDLALGELETQFPRRVRNFHFEPNIENDQLTFDYKLKRGIAEKMNATFLMKKMGIIPADN